ncbi:hypothetical protein [Streptomyces sp. NPDC056323]
MRGSEYIRARLQQGSAELLASAAGALLVAVVVLLLTGPGL